MSSESDTNISLVAIGVARSPVKDGSEMPIEGVPGVVEVLPAYVDGLKGIETNTHLIILGWFHQADRDTLLSTRGGTQGRGVFGIRSPSRPNPIGINTARVVSVHGNEVHLERMDMIDGTPILDIKRYSPGWDSIFSARTSRDRGYPEGRDEAVFLRDMLVEAANFHGETCVGIALGTRIIFHGMQAWHIGKKEPELTVIWGSDGCVNDTLQALSGATSGNARLEWSGNTFYTLRYQDQTLTFTLTDHPPATISDILDAPIDTLFRIRNG